MQETKLADEAFPALTFMALGYESAHHGQGQWNGVAILSKVGLDDVVHELRRRASPTPMPGSSRRRAAASACAASTCPTGGRSTTSTTSTSCAGWRSCAATSPRSARPTTRSSSPATSTSPRRHRRVRPGQVRRRDAHQPEPERAAAGRADATGAWSTCSAQQHSDAKLYSWWDYRAGDFHQGRGLRIDLRARHPHRWPSAARGA